MGHAPRDARLVPAAVSRGGSGSRLSALHTGHEPKLIAGWACWRYAPVSPTRREPRPYILVCFTSSELKRQRAVSRGAGWAAGRWSCCSPTAPTTLRATPAGARRSTWRTARGRAGCWARCGGGRPGLDEARRAREADTGARSGYGREKRMRAREADAGARSGCGREKRARRGGGRPEFDATMRAREAVAFRGDCSQAVHEKAAF